MANTGGPLPSRRKILMEASNSILLYGSEIWAPALRTQVRASKLLSVQRTSALRVTSAYRTVSAGAVLVIAGMIPIDLQAMERHKIFIAKQQSEPQAEYAMTARLETLETWQQRWQNENKGRWTHKVKPNHKTAVTAANKCNCNN
ncbi:uncharacterized protein [Musca autumnalis]|uniref:uncharacterized protein n=1 Tax=Musca autumnalis TaxID=221902 RepID=UPI003CEABB9A